MFHYPNKAQLWSTVLFDFAAVAIATVVAGLGGCGRFDDSLTVDTATFKASTSLVADWNDIDAAVDLAASKSEMAVVRASTNDNVSRVVLLRTIRDEPAWIVITRNPSGTPASESESLTLKAQVGRFGDPDREASLLRHVKLRLENLRGVGSREIW